MAGRTVTSISISGERESAPILRIQTGVLHSGLVCQARCWCDYYGDPNRICVYFNWGGGGRLICRGDWQLRTGVGCAGYFCAMWNSLSFHMSMPLSPGFFPLKLPTFWVCRIGEGGTPKRPLWIPCGEVRRAEVCQQVAHRFARTADAKAPAHSDWQVWWRATWRLITRDCW
jgi:hypothetical protein